MEGQKLLTAAEVLDKLDKAGLSIAEWARRNKVGEASTYAVLSGRSSGRYGKGHQIAVLLGMKEGTIEETGGRV